MKNKKHQVGRLEKFGVGYLQQLRKKLLDSNRQLPNDETLVKGSNRILLYGIVQSALIGAVLVGICIYTDQLFSESINGKALSYLWIGYCDCHYH